MASTSKQANVVYSVEEVAAMFNNSSESIISDVDGDVSGMSSRDLEEFDLDEKLLREGESCDETRQAICKQNTCDIPLINRKQSLRIFCRRPRSYDWNKLCRCISANNNA